MTHLAPQTPDPNRQHQAPLVPASREQLPHLADHQLPSPAKGAEHVDIEALPVAPRPRSLGYLGRQLLQGRCDKDTGLEHLSTDEFFAVKERTRAFAFAVESELREGFWSSLLLHPLLTSEVGRPFAQYLRDHFKDSHVVEMGAGDMAGEHAVASRYLGATSYLGIDLQARVVQYGGKQVDALRFFLSLPRHSLQVIMAFGVLNEPMSLQYPSWNPPSMWLPAKAPQHATRAHAEHEYVRRLTRAMFEALAPDGLLFGDGLHSRGFEREVEYYLHRAGFKADPRGIAALAGVNRFEFGIRNPFFLTKE